MSFTIYSCGKKMNNDWDGTELSVVNDEIFKKNIGKKIIIVGKSVNAKLGALIICKNGEQIWIDNLESWPLNYYNGDENSKTLKIIGTLIEKNDLPVFEENDNEIQQGKPVPKGTNLEVASHRYLLKNVKWKIIEK